MCCGLFLGAGIGGVSGFLLGLLFRAAITSAAGQVHVQGTVAVSGGGGGGDFAQQLADILHHPEMRDRIAAAFDAISSASGVLERSVTGVLLAEHALVVLLVAYWALRTSAWAAGWLTGAGAAGKEPRALLRRVRAARDAVVARAGPPGVLAWPDVRPAPRATMDVNSLKEGQAVSHVDGRGAIYRFKLREGTYVNMYYTKAGHMRSGDLHNATQYDVVLKGRVRLTLKDPVSMKVQVADYEENDFIVIPPRWPHVFEFLEDNCLLEWWDGPFKAWYYDPMRRLIEERAKELKDQKTPNKPQQQQQQGGAASKQQQGAASTKTPPPPPQQQQQQQQQAGGGQPKKPREEGGQQRSEASPRTDAESRATAAGSTS